MKEQETKHFRVDDKGILWFNDRLVVPKDKELRNQIMAEAHSSKFPSILAAVRYIRTSSRIIGGPR
jgi:hypothetical protein